MIVGHPAGGSTDALARVLAEELRSRLGQPVVIENRPGANGTAGAVSVVNAAPDGYMLLTTPSAALTVNPYFQKNFPFHPLTALAPITLAVVLTVVLAVHPSAAKTWSSYGVRQKNSASWSYGSPGIGSGLTSLANCSAEDRHDVAHIPYRGFAPAIQTPSPATSRSPSAGQRWSCRRRPLAMSAFSRWWMTSAPPICRIFRRSQKPIQV